VRQNRVFAFNNSRRRRMPSHMCTIHTIAIITMMTSSSNTLTSSHLPPMLEAIRRTEVSSPASFLHRILISISSTLAWSRRPAKLA